MLNQIKHHLKPFNTVITKLLNRKGCTVRFKRSHTYIDKDDLMDFHFANVQKLSDDRYNIFESDKATIADLTLFDFTQDRFILGDLLELTLGHIDLQASDFKNEFVIALNKVELLEDAEDNGHDTEADHWEWYFIEEAFRGEKEQGYEMEPQRLYNVDEDKYFVHFKLVEA